MLKEMMIREYPDLIKKLVKSETWDKLGDMDVCDLIISINNLLALAYPNDPVPLVRIGEAFQIKKDLLKAGLYYKKVLEMEPPKMPDEYDINIMLKYAPILYTTENEFFNLKDIVAIHHPEKPLIAYHLFWDDDYNYPDDYEPCDHEEIWVSYDVKTKLVDGVWTFYHSYILSSPEAIDKANKNEGHPIIYIEWGIHGSIIDGWETIIINDAGIKLSDFLKNTYRDLSNGGRMKKHPMKQRWPECFKGSFEDYTTFNKPIYTYDYLKNKKMYIKYRWSNPIIQQYFLPYNFAPKYDWPF
jgi:hypothetical protein